MSGKPLVIFGAGELAEVAAYYFESDTHRRIVAFAVDQAHIKETTFSGRPVVPFETITGTHAPDKHDLFVAVGYSRINAVRAEKCESARAKGYTLPSYVSSRASLATNVRYGWNSFILEYNAIQPFATIGNGVILWCGNHIAHHSCIGDFAFICAHVAISGGVKVGERTFIGTNATTNDHISIGARCVIGSGALIVKDVADDALMKAEPAILSPIPSRRLKGF